MRDASQNANGRARSWIGLTAVIAIFVFALFLRAYWNVDAATADGEFLMSAGSDPYYHKRAVDYIQSNGWKTLIHDPLLNYPYGATNPNPPLFQWSVAVGGAVLSPFFDGGIEESTWWVMIWSPAIWGALTIIPTYLIGRDVFNRRTGIIGAFFLGVSTTHIDHTALGAADHDAMLLFLAVTATWAFIRSIQGFRGDGSWVANWRNGANVSDGLSRFVKERRGPIGWAALAGLLIGATGLVWKGFPYLIGVVFAYTSLQLVIDHWRSKDSLGVWFGSFLAVLIGTLVVVPAYAQANVLGFLKPVWFLLAAHVVFGLVMVPTRDLPTILVLPLFAIVGVLGVLTAFFVVPDVARSLLYTTVYFKQTSLYQTIAEAHPADFNQMVFGIGPIAFFLAIFGLAWLAVEARRTPTRASLFMAVWAILAIYMAHSAVRFLFNATPILAVLAGWSVSLTLDWLDFKSIGRNMQGAASFWSGVKRAVSGWHVTGAVLIALLLVFPSIFLAVDASAPPQAEDNLVRASLIDYILKHNSTYTRDELEKMGTGQFSYFQPSGLWNVWFEVRAQAKGMNPENLDSESRKELAAWGGMPVFVARRFGAFGQGFLPSYWNDGLTNLSTVDDFGNAPGNVANRPAFLSWWDYGHWAIEVGKHPTVADNFQNGYVYAANFILAQNETHATQLLSARTLPLVEREQGRAKVNDLLTQAGVPAGDVDDTYERLKRFEYAPALDLASSVKLEGLVTEATKSATRPDGVRIRYFGADIRMLPYDVPGTSYIDQTSIFYAPVTLAERKPGDYVQLQITGTDGRDHTEEEFEKLVRDVRNNPNFGASGQKYVFKQPFFDSMYYRAFVGIPINARGGIDGTQLDQALTNPQPAYGLKHWRLSILNSQLRIIEYFPGAVLKGTVEEDGSPKQGVTVTAYDDAGTLLWQDLTEFGKLTVSPDDLNVPHDSVATNAEGKFELTLPFNLPGGNVTVVVTDGSAEIARQHFVVSRDDANKGRVYEATFSVAKGAVEGRAYFDKDEDGKFDAAAGDEPLSGTEVTIGGNAATTDADGKYALPTVSAGSRAVDVNSADYQVSPVSARVSVEPGRTTTHDVAMRLRTIPVNGTVAADKDGSGAADEGEAASAVSLTFDPVEGSTGRSATATSSPEGTYEVRLVPGTYTVKGATTIDGTEYTFESTLEVPRASVATSQQLDVLLAKA